MMIAMTIARRIPNEKAILPFRVLATVPKSGMFVKESSSPVASFAPSPRKR